MAVETLPNGVRIEVSGFEKNFSSGVIVIIHNDSLRYNSNLEQEIASRISPRCNEGCVLYLYQGTGCPFKNLQLKADPDYSDPNFSKIKITASCSRARGSPPLVGKTHFGPQSAELRSRFTDYVFRPKLEEVAAEIHIGRVWGDP